MARQVEIDPELCVGSGECVRVAPEAFALDEEQGISVVLPTAAIVDEARLLQAARGCPTQAIRVLRADGSVLYGLDAEPSA